MTKDKDFSTKVDGEVFATDIINMQLKKGNINEYLERLMSIYFDAYYIKENLMPWLGELSNKLEGYEKVENILMRKKKELEEKEQELKHKKDELFLKEKNIRTVDAATCVNINKLINKTEDILGKLKDEKEKIRFFEGEMYTDVNPKVGEVSDRQKVLTIVVMVIFLGLLGFVFCIK